MQITQTTSSIATTAEQKLARLKSGAIFIQDTEERIKRAFELAASQKDNVDFIIWLCKQTCILSKNYKTLISKYSEGFRSKLYGLYFAMVHYKNHVKDLQSQHFYNPNLKSLTKNKK